jgi:hypothetical protein
MLVWLSVEDTGIGVGWSYANQFAMPSDAPSVKRWQAIPELEPGALA